MTPFTGPYEIYPHCHYVRCQEGMGELMFKLTSVFEILLAVIWLLHSMYSFSPENAGLVFTLAKELLIDPLKL